MLKNTLKSWREPPPTAGLPLTWGDLLLATGSLERDLAEFVGAPYAQIECSASAALVVALTTLKNLSSRRNVIIPAYTCPLVALALLQAGLQPVACDTRLGHFDFCPDALKNCCNEDTLAIMPTHLGGRLADLATISQIAKSVGAYVVEDAAQSLGASTSGQAAGTLGDIGVYSLGVGKGLTIYGGGVIVTNDVLLSQQLHATSLALAKKDTRQELKKIAELIGYTALYRPSTLKLVFGAPLRRHLQHGRLIQAVGDNHPHTIPMYRVGAWRKTVAAQALKRLPWFLAQTKAQATQRKARLQTIAGISVIDDVQGEQGTWPYLLVLMPSQQARNSALAMLWPAGLGVGRMFIHALPDYPDLSAAFTNANTPNARDFAARTLTITNSPWLKDKEFERICVVLEASTA